MSAGADAPGAAIRVLLVDDDEDDFVLTRDLLADLGPTRYALDWAPTFDEALAALARGGHDVGLLDYNLGARTGLELLEEAVARGCHAPLILLTGQGHRSIDVEAMRAGAADYLPKSRMDSAQLERTIRFALERKRNEDSLIRLRDDLEERVAARTAELREANARLRQENAERRQAEQERERLLALEQQARAEAEAASLAKDRIIATLSHELRTPLNPILLAASALEGDPQVPEAIRPMMAMIRRNVELESRLIDDLLDSTRIARGLFVIRREATDAHALISAAMEICAPEIRSASLRLEVHLEASRRHVEGDAARLQQVVWNLLRNAAKFTPAGGSIRVRTWNEPGADGAFALEVADTGIGIESAALGRIFEAFEQGGEVDRTRYGGLGLGLAIARAVTEAHGGTIAAESDGRGLGARFVVRLPTSEAPSATVGRAARPAPSSASPRSILLVEDDPSTLQVLARLLRIEGHRVSTAGCVASALEAFRRDEPDLIISDVGLPGASGLDLIREVRAIRPVRAIALTGYGTEADVEKAHRAGFHAHLTKPINFGRLREVIRELG